MNRDKALLTLTEAIRELVDRVEMDTKFTRETADGRKVLAEDVTHRVTAPGLLPQLVEALRPGGGGGGDAFRSKPGGRPPSAPYISNILGLISQEVAKLRADMRAEAGSSKPPAVQARRTVRADLMEVRSLAFSASDARLSEALRLVTRWQGKAREALTWDAPVVTLVEAPCPYCGGELRVRSDASSDVWCAGSPAGPDRERTPPCQDEEGDRRHWPQSSWLLLLERLSQPA